MGIFGGGSSLGLGASKSKNKQAMESESTTTLYDKDTLAALKEQVLSGLPAYENLISGEDERAASALETLGTLTKGGNIDVDAIMAAAKQDSDTALGQSYQNLARSVGAVDNSLVQLAYDAAATDAATQLAGTRAELEAANADKQAQAAQAILGSLGVQDQNRLNALNSLISAYRGGETTEKSRSSGFSTTKSMSGQLGAQW